MNEPARLNWLRLMQQIFLYNALSLYSFILSAGRFDPFLFPMVVMPPLLCLVILLGLHRCRVITLKDAVLQSLPYLVTLPWLICFPLALIVRRARFHILLRFNSDVVLGLLPLGADSLRDTWIEWLLLVLAAALYCLVFASTLKEAGQPSCFLPIMTLGLWLLSVILAALITVTCFNL